MFDGSEIHVVNIRMGRSDQEENRKSVTSDPFVSDGNNALEFLSICYSLIPCFSKVAVTKHYSNIQHNHFQGAAVAPSIM